jgi:protein TonB
MTQALLYQSPHKSRFGAALAGAIVIHLAAFSFAKSHSPATAGPPSSPGGPAEITFEPIEPVPDPAIHPPDPSPAPPVTEQSFPEERSSPPPLRKQHTTAAPIVRARASTNPGSMPFSSAKVLAVNAPRPEYPYEARRQKITGDGLVVMTVDPADGNVTSVSMSKTTGSPFLDNAAIAGFKRWRFKPGTVSSVTCPVTFTLTGASY